jgi:predicted metal-binding protein
MPRISPLRLMPHTPSSVQLHAATLWLRQPLAAAVRECLQLRLATPRPAAAAFLVALWVLLAPEARAADADALGSREAKACMTCHNKAGLTAVYKDGEKRSVVILEEHFRDSAHKFLPCTGCHSSLPAAGPHASSSGVTREQVSIEVAATCRRCHTNQQLSANPLHKQILAYKDVVRCADCHGSHNIQRVWRMKASYSLNQYCLLCHKHTLKSSHEGEFSSLEVCESDLKSSVHCNHSCTDCHIARSKDDHPIYKNERDLSLAVADACAGCHADKQQAYKGSVHSHMVARGNPKAPVCTDCHGSHQVRTKALFDTLAGIPCKKCHGDVFSKYDDSVHGAAREAGSTTAPLCANCHFAHEVKPALISRSTRLACLGCHPATVERHGKWLPNTQGHFDAVACASCHVPDAPRAVFLQVTDARGNVLPEPEIKRLLGTSYDTLLSSSAEGSIEGPQLWELYKRLNRDVGGAGLTGTLAPRDGLQAHGLVHKNQAIKRCETCHSSETNHFQTVLMVVPREDGTEQYYPVSPNVLQSVFATLPIKQFYAMGNTRTRLLDWGGLLMGVGLVFGLGGHMGLRAFAKSRLRRKEVSR